jgi:DNA-binding NarL/FixJ family response regulator
MQHIHELSVTVYGVGFVRDALAELIRRVPGFALTGAFSNINEAYSTSQDRNGVLVADLSALDIPVALTVLRRLASIADSLRLMVIVAPAQASELMSTISAQHASCILSTDTVAALRAAVTETAGGLTHLSAGAALLRAQCT